MPPRRCAWAIASVLSCLGPVSVLAETYSSLPPPPVPPPGQQNGRQQYMLGLIVNEQDKQVIAPVIFRDGHYLLRASDLQRVGIPAGKLPAAAEVDISVLPEIGVNYDSQRQLLALTVPPAWLPGQTFNEKDDGPRFPGQASNGLLVNYDAYASRIQSGSSRVSLLTELRLFGDSGQLSTNGIYQQSLAGKVEGLDDDYVRYDTFWSSEDENQVMSWRVGDLITNGLAWSSSVRLGGIQIGRDFSVRPDLVTYPLPAFAGQAAVPSTVDLFVNGYQTSRNSVQPGPYSLTNLPFVNGAGDAVIVTTDALGRQVTTTLPFYVSSDLLKPGLSDFSVSAGAIRQNYGIKSFDYDSPAVSGSYRYGMTNWLTLETHIEAAESMVMGGGGAQFKVASLGVVNAALAQSQFNGEQGTQYNWGYQYSYNGFSVGTQHSIRTQGFGNLALVSNHISDMSTANDNGRNNMLSALSRRSAQYNTSLSLSQFGNLGAAYIEITSGNGEQTRLGNLSWSRTLWSNSSLYVSASRDLRQGNWSGAISLVIPFGEHGSSSIGMERDQEGNTSERFYVSRSMPSDGGFAWDASWANQAAGSAYRQGTLRWRNQVFDTAAGFYGDGDSTTQWGEFSGSLVLMDNHLFAANQINDAFVLVKTGYPNVSVRYENQPMGRTDKEGYLLVPRVNSWYPAKYDLDTLDLPSDVSTPGVEQRFAVKRKSGFLLNFPVEPLRSASVILLDLHQQPLPVSSMVMRPGHNTEYVGYDGLVWMEALSEENPIHAETPDGRQCDTTLHLPTGRPQALKTYGPLTCPLPDDAAPSNSENSTSGITP